MTEPSKSDLSLIGQRFAEACSVLRLAGEKLAGPLAQAAGVVARALRQGGGVYIFGNGGSAADAQHIAGELVGRFLLERRALRAVALSSDVSVLTCLANDYGYDRVFARQIEALGRQGDVAIGLSTSGRSANILAAIAAAREMGMKTVVFTGGGGGPAAGLADVLLDVPSDFTPYIQQCHVALYHLLCELVERELAQSPSAGGNGCSGCQCGD